jgi:hypothetical protein
MNVLIAAMAFVVAIGYAVDFVAMAVLRGRVERLEGQIKLLAAPFDKEEMTEILQDAIARWASELEAEELT